MLNDFLEALSKAETVLTGKRPHRVTWSVAASTGVSDNEVVRLSWKDEQGKSCSAILTEDGIYSGTYNARTMQFEVYDKEGEPISLLLLTNGVPIRLPENWTPPGDIFYVVQEGGSTGEVYLHGNYTEVGAMLHQDSCANAAYRTSHVIKVPRSLADHPDFGRVAEEFAKAFLSFETRSRD